MPKLKQFLQFLRKKSTSLTSFYLLLVLMLCIAAFTVIDTTRKSIASYDHITKNAIDISHILLDVRREAEASQTSTIRIIFNTQDDDVEGEKETLTEVHDRYEQTWEDFKTWTTRAARTDFYDTLNFYRQQDHATRQKLFDMSIKGDESNQEAIVFYYDTQHVIYSSYQDAIEITSKKVREAIAMNVSLANRKTTEGSRKVNLLLLIVLIMLGAGAMLVTKNHRHLSRMKKMAEASSKAKSEFMSNMSHELRTPMNGIIGFTDLILTTPLKPVQKEYLKNVNKSAHNLMHIINDILDFSKIEAGKLLLDKTAFNLRELVEETVDLLSINAAEKKLEVICNIDPILPSQFTGDASRIRQILVNLMGNAVKFTTKGEVVIELKSKSASPAANKKIMNVEISVRDTGIGIPANKIKEVFENFTQVDSSTTRRFGGTGLGLTIARALAELMSGSLTAESTIGKGSTFTFAIPLEVVNEKPSISFPSKARLKKVLVVDDNETNCSLMRNVFEYVNIPCDISTSGPEAITLIQSALSRNNMYDVIVTDHQMPEMDGITMVKRIKQLIGSAPMPFVLMLSSMDRAVYQQQATDSGIDQFLNKPIKLKDLSNMLTNGFAQQKASAELRNISIATHTSSRADILVVEDDPINMLLINEVLTRMGFGVIKASNGKAAIEMLTQIDPALIFMDVNMPEMDGYATTRLIRNMPEPWCSLPVIALTADAMVGDKERCIAAGMDDYVSKPFRVEDINSVISQYYYKKKETA